MTSLPIALASIEWLIGVIGSFKCKMHQSITAALRHVFSRKSKSRIANVRLSVCPLVHPLAIKTPQPLRIGHHAYRPSCPLAIMSIRHLVFFRDF